MINKKFSNTFWILNCGSKMRLLGSSHSNAKLSKNKFISVSKFRIEVGMTRYPSSQRHQICGYRKFRTRSKSSVVRWIQSIVICSASFSPRACFGEAILRVNDLKAMSKVKALIPCPSQKKERERKEIWKISLRKRITTPELKRSSCSLCKFLVDLQEFYGGGRISREDFRTRKKEFCSKIHELFKKTPKFPMAQTGVQ